MAGSQIERVFSVLESLTSDPRGLPMQTLAEQLDIPKSATHRLLAELITGWVDAHHRAAEVVAAFVETNLVGTFQGADVNLGRRDEARALLTAFNFPFRQ